VRTIDEILADMSAIITKAELTADDLLAYQALELELAQVQEAAAPDEATEGETEPEPAPATATATATAPHAPRTAVAAARARHASYTRVVVPAGRPSNRATSQRETEADGFRAYLRTGRVNADLTPVNAQGTSSGPGGGFLVPETFRERLVDRRKAFGGLANVVDTITTTTGENILWPTIDDTANTGEVVDEGGTFTGGADLLFGEANLGAYQYMAGGAGGTPLRLSTRLVSDSAIDIEGLVADKLGMRVARIQAPHWVSGTGVKQPQGIITGKTPVGSAANTAVTYADLLGWIHSVDPEYRDSARWAFNDTSLQFLRGIVDSAGRPIIKGSTEGAATGAGGEVLLGYPVTIDQGFSNLNKASGTTVWGVFGDLQEAYVIRQVQDVAVLVNPYARQEYGQIQYSALAWADAVQQNTAAYSTLTCHN
jgi:HK97 family phage major capsid protein